MSLHEVLRKISQGIVIAARLLSAWGYYNVYLIHNYNFRASCSYHNTGVIEQTGESSLNTETDQGTSVAGA